jgi:hypothetical protein
MRYLRLLTLLALSAPEARAEVLFVAASTTAAALAPGRSGSAIAAVTETK